MDQRTRECDWSLVEYLSGLKKQGCKAELFYFLAQGWMDRHWHLTNESNLRRLREWWGRDDWSVFRDMKSTERAEYMEHRFRDELGYQFSQAFPIHKYGNHGRVMFWMIHASDDQRALPLMAKSYEEIGLNMPPPKEEQMKIDIAEIEAEVI